MQNSTCKCALVDPQVGHPPTVALFFFNIQIPVRVCLQKYSLLLISDETERNIHQTLVHTVRFPKNRAPNAVKLTLSKKRTLLCNASTGRAPPIPTSKFSPQIYSLSQADSLPPPLNLKQIFPSVLRVGDSETKVAPIPTRILNFPFKMVLIFARK